MDWKVKSVLKLKPNLVVMDIGLPKLDGIAAAQQIKAALPTVRVVMLTSHTAEHEMIAALASGTDAYCVKGTSLEQLWLAIAVLSGVAASSLKQTSFIFGETQLANTLQENLDQLLQSNSDTTGLSTMVTAPDDTVWVGTAGFSNLETQTPVDANDIFGAGSITKPIVATVVL